VSRPPGTLSPAEVLAGRRLLLVGGTGFLGKVALSLLLDRFPQVGRIYLMVRPGAGAGSEERFWRSVLPSPAFDPLRQRYGERLEAFLREKLVIVGGDVTRENLGYSEEEAERIAADIDVLVNCSGRVSFNPPLEAALKTNVNGTRNTLAFAKRMKRPALIHVSTCFVAGNRSGEVWENEPLVGYFPKRGELEVAGFSVEQEIRDCERLAARVRDEAEDHSLADRFREAARRRFMEEGRDPDDEKALRLAIASERKNWIRGRLTELGVAKANWWGWPNIYTYTKSLGEQLVAAETGMVRSIIRPAIVESALGFPFPGWNEGFNTTAPLIHLALKGQNLFPVREDVILDVIPVDSVAAAVIAITAQACVEEPALVHQLSSGDLNPARLGRLVTLLGLYKREHFQRRESGSRLLNEIAARMEAQTVSPAGFERYSLPMLHRATRAVAEFLDRVPPHRFGPLSGMAQQVRNAVADFEAFTQKGEEDYHTFKPFIVENAYVFRADNVRALFERLKQTDRKLLHWSPQSIDWYDYWLRVHLPGLEKWVFPKLEESDKPKPRRVYTYSSLIELFDGVTKVHAGRVAMRMERKGREERYTYADLRECGLRAAAFLVGQGVGPGERVGLLSENCPEWGMSYFGIIKAGAAAIPIEKEATTEEVVNLLRMGEASGIFISDELAAKHPDLSERLGQAGVAARVWRFEQVFALGDEELERQRIAALPAAVRADALASLIFTSGTTGNPKGVMLTHRNFTSLVAKLLSVYDLESRDGMLSVLPLHHSFEFSTGFLLPLSRGAQITYVSELTGEVLSRVLKKGQVTCIVGVPALWESLKRRISGRIGERAAWLEDLAEAVIDANYLLRDETPFNFGPLVFFPIHLAFGGKIRYLISGGSALSSATLKTFRGLGFNLYEGYGLTEAAPVLTVTRPGERVIEGSVGKPLPGIELTILNPDRRGVGEVLARGPNVMAGYFGNEAATRAAFHEGWLRTGDQGRLDEEGNLYLVGRLKEIIVDANGKNVYPEELEEIYCGPEAADFIKEMSIVGLPEGAAERVAALVVPNYEADRSASRAELRAKIEEHFHRVSATLPLYKRVKTLVVWDGELPRTPTRKVKRREAVLILQRLRRQADQAAVASGREGGESAEPSWLLDAVASIAEKPRAAVHLDSRLDELGFDSLMYNELAVAIEAAGVEPPSAEVLAGVTDLRELAELLRRAAARKEDASGPRRLPRAGERSRDIHIPPLAAEWGKRGLSAVQRWFYHELLQPEFRGRGHIPTHTHFIVAANHASHLDMGLAKMALGEAGKNLVALAAADYFFNTKLKRAIFENLTNLVPMERKGSLRRSLRWAFALLEQGYNVLIFPEGTRSRTGEMQRFQRGLGYLALRAGVGVLPMHLSTFHALPPGSWYPKSRKVSAAIGPFLPHDMLARLTEGMPRAEAERWVTALVQKAVEDLRDGIEPEVREELLRQRQRAERPPAEWVPVTSGKAEKNESSLG
jgi:long-chain acyl-CoA synthetase